MSRIGKEPIKIPESVKIDVNNQTIKVKGPKGELVRDIHPYIKVDIEDNVLLVKRSLDNKIHKSLHGLTRALINNMVIGVTEGFKKSLEIVGVGYRAEKKKSNIVFSLGYSHPIVFVPPEDIDINLERHIINISGIDKELVGQVAAKIRSFRPPEPYKGKGIKYIGEVIKRKAGKAAV